MMTHGFVLLTPLLLLLLLGLLSRFIGCASFSAAPGATESPVPETSATTTTLTSSPQPSMQGAPVTFTAKVSAASGGPVVGVVNFNEGATNLAIVPVDSSGQAVHHQVFTSAGTHTIHAVYSDPASGFYPSIGAIDQVVTGTPAPVVAYRQGTENNETVNNSSISTAAFGANTGAGDLIVVWIFWHAPAGQTLTGVTDSAGNTYQRALPPIAGTGGLAGITQEMWYAKNIKSVAAVKVTATFSAVFNDNKGIAAFEYANVDVAAPVDVSASGSGNGVNAFVGGGPTKTTTPGMIFTAAVFGTAGTLMGGGYIQRSSLQMNAAGEEVHTAPGPASATFTNAAQDWVAQMVAFKQG